MSHEGGGNKNTQETVVYGWPPPNGEFKIKSFKTTKKIGWDDAYYTDLFEIQKYFLDLC